MYCLVCTPTVIEFPPDAPGLCRHSWLTSCWTEVPAHCLLPGTELSCSRPSAGKEGAPLPVSQVTSLQSSPSWESPLLNQQAQTLPASFLGTVMKLWLQAAEPQLKLKLLTLLSPLMLCSLLDVYWHPPAVLGDANTQTILHARTFSFSLNLSKVPDSSCSLKG